MNHLLKYSTAHCPITYTLVVPWKHPLQTLCIVIIQTWANQKVSKFAICVDLHSFTFALLSDMMSLCSCQRLVFFITWMGKWSQRNQILFELFGICNQYIWCRKDWRNNNWKKGEDFHLALYFLWLYYYTMASQLQ